jgi:hypothetical protein
LWEEIFGSPANGAMEGLTLQWSLKHSTVEGHLNAFEYVAVNVENLLLVATKGPSSIIYALEEQQQFKLKGTGPLQYHQGIILKRCALVP